MTQIMQIFTDKYVLISSPCEIVYINSIAQNPIFILQGKSATSAF